MTNERIVYVCSNYETLTDGYFSEVDAGRHGCFVGDEIVSAGAEVIEGDSRVTCKLDSSFRNWHGGRRKNKIGITIKGVTYGYPGTRVMTHAENPPQWLRDLCDRAEEAMVKKSLELSADLQAS
jgi:hypothetical protein